MLGLHVPTQCQVRDSMLNTNLLVRDDLPRNQTCRLRPASGGCPVPATSLSHSPALGRS